MVALSKISQIHASRTTGQEISIDTSVASTVLDLSPYVGYNTLTIQVENNGAIGGSSLAHTLALTGGIGGTDLTVPSGLFVTGAASFANVTTTSYNAIVILKAGSLTSLKLTFTRSGTSPTGLLRVRIMQSDCVV